MKNKGINISLSDHLSEYSITISEARDFIVSNIGNPGEILSFGRSHNLTAQMLADIYRDLNANRSTVILMTQAWTMTQSIILPTS